MPTRRLVRACRRGFCAICEPQNTTTDFACVAGCKTSTRRTGPTNDERLRGEASQTGSRGARFAAPDERCPAGSLQKPSRRLSGCRCQRITKAAGAMTRDVKVNGSTYNLEGLSDEEVAAFVKERATIDGVMEMLASKYSPDEIAALGQEQLRGEIERMGGFWISQTPKSQEPAPGGLLAKAFEIKEPK